MGGSMAYFTALLTTFRGRITRLQWWLGFVIWLLGSMAGSLLLNPEFFTADEMPPPVWSETIFQLAWLVPFAAVSVKRFNDRDWPWWPGYAIAALSAVFVVAPHFGVAVDPSAGGIGAVIFYIGAIAGFVALIDNGFMRGTDGPNRYGPDPLARSTQIA